MPRGGAVGVKGRPQACVTCHRRKKGCDLQRPACGQCRRSCIPCGGYTRGPASATASRSGTPGPLSTVGHWEASDGTLGGRFIRIEPNATAPRSRSDAVAAAAAAAGAIVPAGGHATSRAMAETGSATDMRRWHQQQHRYLKYCDTRDISASQPLSTSAQHERIIGLFWEAYLPNSQNLPETTSRLNAVNSSVSPLQQFRSSNPVFRKALLATAYTTLSKRPGGLDWMRRDGMRLYAESITEMSTALAEQTGTWKGIELLAAARMFALYEALYGTEIQDGLSQERSWTIHSTGDEAMLTSKPPSFYIDGLAHNLFTSGRHHVAMSCILHRRRTVLSKPEWKTIPWTKHPKTPRDHILDIIIDIPDIAVALEAMAVLEPTPKKDYYRRSIRTALFRISARLQEWHDKYAFEVVPTTLNGELPPEITPDQLADAHCMTLYWAMSMRATQFIRQISVKGEALDDRIDENAYCRNIIRALRLFFHPNVGHFRHFATAMPLSTAIHYLASADNLQLAAERKLLLEELKRPEAYFVRKFVHSLEPKNYREDSPAQD